MPVPARVLLLDDGELSAVARLLDELGIPFERRSGEPCGNRALGLLIATARRAAIAGRPATVRIAVADDGGRDERDRLRALGFQLLVRTSTRRELWQLLIEHAQGGDVLLDVANRGCRLRLASAPTRGSRVKLEIPVTWDGDPEPLCLRGVVAARHGQGPAGGGLAAVVFEDVSDADRTRLSDWLNRLAPGSDALAPPLPIQLPARGGRTAEAIVLDDETDPLLAAHVPVSFRLDSHRPECAGPERRQRSRGAYLRRVEAVSRSGRRVLMGRDLSAGGMRIESHPELALGDRLRIAIYTPGRIEPFRVRARVTRNDGEAGLGLRFHDIDPETGEGLEKLVAHLPEVESLEDGRFAGLGAVISEILLDDGQ